MDRHKGLLRGLCRVGGGNLASNHRSFPVESFRAGLRTTFGLDVSKDHKSVHPDQICHKCERVIKRVSEGAHFLEVVVVCHEIRCHM